MCRAAFKGHACARGREENSWKWQLQLKNKKKKKYNKSTYHNKQQPSAFLEVLWGRQILIRKDNLISPLVSCPVHFRGMAITRSDHTWTRQHTVEHGRAPSLYLKTYNLASLHDIDQGLEHLPTGILLVK